MLIFNVSTLSMILSRVPIIERKRSRRARELIKEGRGEIISSHSIFIFRLSDFLEIYFLNYFVVCQHQHHQCQTITQQNNKSRNATSRNSLVILILEVSTSSGKDFSLINCEREWMNPVRVGALILFIDSVKEAILQSKAKQQQQQHQRVGTIRVRQTFKNWRFILLSKTVLLASSFV